MGKKERILDLIKDNDGLTYATLRTKYNLEFKQDTLKKKSGYVYLKRLKNDGLIENDKGINVLYKPTALALNKDSESLENPLHKIVLRKLLKPFAEKGIKMNLEPIEVKEIEKLWSESNE